MGNPTHLLTKRTIPPNYCVNTNPEDYGYHEVHRMTCAYVPNPDYRILLGTFSSPGPAIQEARKRFMLVKGCFQCCLGHHLIN